VPAGQETWKLKSAINNIHLSYYWIWTESTPGTRASAEHGNYSKRIESKYGTVRYTHVVELATRKEN
jgi:hypothetical protein